MAVNKTSSYVITGRFTDGIPSDTSFSVLEGLAGTTSSIQGCDAAVASGRATSSGGLCDSWKRKYGIKQARADAERLHDEDISSEPDAW
jgi:hypothetical protein